MTCETYRERWIEEPVETALADAHLADCADCAALIEQWVEAEQRLREHFDRFAAATEFDTAWPGDREMSRQASGSVLHVLALAAAVVLVLVAAWSTVSSPESDKTKAVQPAPAEPAQPNLEYLPLEVGSSLVLGTPRPPVSFAVDDPKLAVAVALSGNTFVIHGLSPGRTVVRVDLGDRVSNYPCEVGPATDRPLGEGTVRLAIGESVEKTWERKPVAFAVSGPALSAALVEGVSLTLTGAAPGRVTVSVVFEEPGPPEVFEVLVESF